MLLTINDLQGDIGGFSETNILNDQLDTGEFSVPTFLGAVKDSGAVHVTLEENGGGDDVTKEVHGGFDDTKSRKKTSHQGTQTKPFSLPIVDAGDHEPIEEARMDSF